MSALFDEIRKKGDGITGGLKHVTDDQKVYKQEKKDVQAVSFDEMEKKKAAIKEQKAAAAAAAAGSAGGEKAAAAEVYELQGGKKWVIQNHDGPSGDLKKFTIDEVGFNMGVYIAQCSNCFIEVTGKINSLAIVGCTGVKVLLTSIVGVCEITKSTNVDVQVAKQLPCAQLDGSHNIQLYLLDSELSRETEVVTSGCSAVNINFPDKDDERDLLEKNIPEQFISNLVKDPKTGKVKVSIKAADI